MKKIVIILIILIVIIILYNVYAYYSAFESGVESVWIEKVNVIGDECLISGYIIDGYLVVKGYDVEVIEDSINITIHEGLKYFPDFKRETMSFNIHFRRPENVSKILLIDSRESKVLWTK